MESHDDIQLSGTRSNGGFIYILHCETLNCCKIGWSETQRGIEQRVRACSTFCPAEIKLVAAFSGSLQDEQTLHRYFKAQHIRNEWFVYSEEIKSIVRKADEVKVDANLNAVVGARPSKQTWNPARWIARGAVAQKLRKPPVWIKKRRGSKFLIMRLRNPLTKQEIARSSGETDRDLAMQKAIVWRDEWWENLRSQLTTSRKERRKLVL